MPIKNLIIHLEGRRRERTGIVRTLEFSVHLKITFLNMMPKYKVKKLWLHTNYKDKDIFAAVLS